MLKSGFGDAGDFEAMARQYWSAWGESMRQAGLGAAAPQQPASQHWRQAMDWWTQLLPAGRSPANDAVDRFNQQARDWYGQMQQLAAQFAGRDSSAADVGQAWRSALGANADGNPFTDLFKAMRGPGAHGLDEWLDQVRPLLGEFQQYSRRWQQLPAFGQYREHQERWQALQLAQQDYQQRSDAFNALMLKCAQRAFEAFEDKLAAREEPGRQITSARALFDLWIDAAEQAYAEIALSLEFREVSGALTNAQMRLRAGIQREVELLGGLFGMPSRTEVDSAHRKIAELERALRRAGNAGRADRGGARQHADGASARQATVAEAAPVPRTRPAVRKGARKPAAGKPARAQQRKPGIAKDTRAKPVKTRRSARSVAATPSKVEPVKAAPPITPKRVATRPAKGTSGKSVIRRRAAGAAPEVIQAVAKKRPAHSTAEISRPSARKVPATNRKPSSGVVSMKDWVARYAAANLAELAPPATGKRGHKGVRK